MKILHTFQVFEANDAGTERRNAYAQRTREATAADSRDWTGQIKDCTQVFNWRFLLTPDHRDSRSIGERRACPFIKDVLDEACNITGRVTWNPDVVVYSNTDCAVVPAWYDYVAAALEKSPCCFSPRVDVERFPDNPLDALDLAIMPAHVGADLFAFRRDWWISVREKFPDMILGFEGWDFVMKCVMLRSGFHPSMLQPIVYHERHTSSWTRKLVETPGQVYCRAVGRRWAHENGLSDLCFDASESAFAFKPTPEVLCADAQPKKTKRHRMAVVQLGRFGDIVNALPVAKHYADVLDERVAFVAHPDFVSMLDGCSYVHPYAATVRDVTDVAEATEAALAIADDVIVTQVYGNNNARRRRDSFCLDSWRLAGLDHKWDDLPLVFDLRNPKREAELILKYSWVDWALCSRRPVVGHCGGGHSSPTPWWSAFIASLGALIGPEPIWLDLSQITAERPFGLLGIMERCDALVLADSMPLHLSYATNTKTVGVITGQPTRWHGTAPRRHWVACVRYADAITDTGVRMVADALEAVWRSSVSRPAHNQEVAGSNPAAAIGGSP